MSEFNRSLRSKSWSSFLFGFGFLVGLVNGSFRSLCGGVIGQGAKVPSGRVLIHDIKEVEDVGQQEQQGDKRDD